MDSSNRSVYAQQENTHPHITALPPNSFPPVTKPRRSNNATTARMTTPNSALIASNGMYSNDVPLHHVDQERQMPPSGMTLEFTLNGSHDGNETLDENPRKRANNEPHEYPRRRVTTACEVCRGRKSRCDGAKPRCKLCTELKVDCVYREPGVKLDAGDKLILEHLDRLDSFVRSSLGALMRESGLNIDPFLASNGSISRDGMEVRGGTHTVDGFGPTQNGGSERHREPISSMSKVPTHPTLHLLEWPKIRELVSRPYDPQLLLQMEMKRKSLEVPISLSLDFSNKEASIQSFFEDANVWYACVDPATWTLTYKAAESHDFREVPESCLVLLVLALGSISSAGKGSQTPRDEEPPGMQYFSAAWGLMPMLMTSHDIVASQCIVLASAYLFYLVRPFEAWTLLTSTNTKLQLLFGPSSKISPQSKELANRVMWNAILFESSLHYEVELPQSNLIYCEASLNLPSTYPEDDGSPAIATDESWYLIATISLHRLQLRIHQAIYSKEAPSTTARLEPIMASLDAGLSQWDESLPIDHRPPTSGNGHLAETCLLLRYYATRALIFRPFLLVVLENPPPPPPLTTGLPPGLRSACANCLESCLRQLKIVRAINQQCMHSPYVWQETLSAVGQTLLVMGASMIGELAELLEPIEEDLDGLIEGVVRVVEGLGRRAPSLKVAAEILREAEGRRRGGWWRDGVVGNGGGPVGPGGSGGY